MEPTRQASRVTSKKNAIPAFPVPNLTQRFDAVILGGGPAGCAAAIMLARAGCRTALVERSGYQSPRAGEMLAPRANVVLHQLGVWEDFQQCAPIPATGIDSCWGADEVRSTDFIFSPYGNGWHLNRSQFDLMLMEKARQSGAAVSTGCLGTSVEGEGAGSWKVEFRAGNRVARMHTERLINATGRTSRLPGLDYPKRLLLDGLAGISRSFRMKSHTSARTLIESRPEGWWYAAALPGDTTIVVFLTDSDLIDCARKDLDKWFSQRLSETRTIQPAVRGAHEYSPLRVHSASSGFAVIPSARWTAAGDAAQSYDPLCGEGIVNALDSGINAAQSLLNDRSQPAEAAQRIDQFTRYLEARRAVYSTEGRWASHPFWKRRSQPVREFSMLPIERLTV